MFTVADVKCYHCGFISGELTVERGQPVNTAAFQPVAAYAGSETSRTGRLRCYRCSGPVYLEDVRTVRPRSVIPFADVRPRRGRPRRSEELDRAS